MRRDSDDLPCMKTRLLLLALGHILILSEPVMARERYEFYNGIRGLSMGGAAIGTVNDETALIVNPAGLGRLRDFYITIADPEVELGVQTEQVIGTGVMDVIDPQKVLDKAKEKPGKHLHTRAQVFPSIVVPNFGIGVFAKNVVDAEVNLAGDEFTYDYTNDYAIVAGFNFRFWDGIIKVGANGRVVNRTEVRRDDILTTETGLTLNNLAASGIGVASDAGLILTLPVASLPSISGVYRDLGGTNYSLRDGMFMTTANDPARTKSTLDTALSFQPILGKRTRSIWSLELRDALNVEEEKDIMRRAHFGVELNVADAFFLRAGMNQRYWSAGFELSTGNYQFQVASYGEDIGADEAPVEDRRYVAKFAFRF